MKIFIFSVIGLFIFFSMDIVFNFDSYSIYEWNDYKTILIRCLDNLIYLCTGFGAGYACRKIYDCVIEK